MSREQYYDVAGDDVEETPFPQTQICESIRVSYKDPVEDVQRSEDVFLDPRDAWSKGGSLLLVNATSVAALQMSGDQEQTMAYSSQLAAEQCRRDFLREQQAVLEKLRKLLESPFMSKSCLAEGKEVLRTAMSVAEETEKNFSQVVSQKDLAEVLDWYVPKAEIDDHLIKYFKNAGLDLSDEATIRLLLKRVRHTHRHSLKSRADMKNYMNGIDG
ncbi:unnamed protein product, partial [Polarella glacialis]